MFTETQKQELRRKGYQEYEIQRLEVYGNEKQRQEIVEKIINASFDEELIRRDLRRKNIIEFL